MSLTLVTDLKWLITQDSPSYSRGKRRSCHCAEFSTTSLKSMAEWRFNSRHTRLNWPSWRPTTLMASKVFPAFSKRLGRRQNPSVCGGERKNLGCLPGVEPLLSGDRMCGCIYGNCINKVITALHGYSFNNLITYSANRPQLALPRTAGKLRVITHISHRSQSVHTSFLYSEIRASERKKLQTYGAKFTFHSDKMGGELTFISWGWVFHFRHCTAVSPHTVNNFKKNSRQFRKWKSLTRISPPCY